jgi:hypothetical protein
MERYNSPSHPGVRAGLEDPMKRRPLWLVLLLALFLMSACSDDTTTAPDEIGETGGDWAGFWEAGVTNKTEDCDVDLSRGCVEIIQDGNIFWFADDPSLTVTIIPGSDSATYGFQETVDGIRTTLDGSFSLNDDTITGFMNYTLNGEVSCNSSWRVNLSRVSDCETAKGWVTRPLR